MEATIVYWGYLGMMEKKVETTILYWGYVGIMEKKMKTTGVGSVLGFRIWGLAPTDAQEENGEGLL